MRRYTKKNFPPLTSGGSSARPIVLIVLAQGGAKHHDAGMAHDAGLFAGVRGYIWDQNHSYSPIRRHECVINLPTLTLIYAVIGIGNRYGPEVDKFEKFLPIQAA